MVKILFVCHGNICRSPMAEFVMKDMVRKAGLEGNPISKRKARQITKEDYDAYDYIIGMDMENMRDLARIMGGDSAGKIHLLLDFVGEHRDVADPWYTGDFDTTYEDVSKGCERLLQRLMA